MFAQEVEVKLEFLGQTSWKKVNPWKMGKIQMGRWDVEGVEVQGEKSMRKGGKHWRNSMASLEDCEDETNLTGETVCQFINFFFNKKTLDLQED